MKLFMGIRRENLDFAEGVFPINLGEIYENLPLEHPEVERAIRAGSLIECSPSGDVTVTEEPIPLKIVDLEDVETEDE